MNQLLRFRNILFCNYLIEIIKNSFQKIPISYLTLLLQQMNAAAKKLIDEMSKPNVSDKSTSKSEASSSRGSFFGAAARRIANSRHNGKSHDGKQRHSFPLFSFGGSSTSSDNSGKTFVCRI